MIAGTAHGRFVAAARACGLRASDRVAVALSGGPDSMALASMTAWWQGYVRSKSPLMALIVDHRMRPGSTMEAQEVAAQAEGLGMQARVLTVEWPDGVPPPHGDKMAAAREARYGLLLRACGKLGRSHLLLAHHADDQAETFLLRLIHASGVLGLACMPPIAEKRTEYGRVQVVRPLLDFRKAELEAYCQRGGIPFVTDPTNADLSFHRNRIRHVLQQTYLHLPALPPPGTAGAAGPDAGGSTAEAAPAWAAGGGHGVIPDILLLQRRCHEAMLRQQALGDHLLSWVTLRTSLAELPQRPREQEQQGQPAPAARQRRPWQRQRPPMPWHINWDDRLAQVGYALRSLPYALLDASCFPKAQGAVAVGALSRMLQAVSGRKYPPPLAHVTRLHQLLQPGRMDHVFTGGGCLAKSLARSKGRYVLCVAYSDWERVQERLARLQKGWAEQLEAAKQAARGAAGQQQWKQQQQQAAVAPQRR